VPIHLQRTIRTRPWELALHKRAVQRTAGRRSPARLTARDRQWLQAVRLKPHRAPTAGPRPLVRRIRRVPRVSHLAQQSLRMLEIVGPRPHAATTTRARQGYHRARRPQPTRATAGPRRHARTTMLVICQFKPAHPRRGQRSTVGQRSLAPKTFQGQRP